MVKFTQNLDRNYKLYIPKAMREAGFGPVIEIIPNFKVAIIYPAGTSLQDILASLKVIKGDLENRAKIGEKIVRRS